ncbi:acetolactate decarboxylase [Streptomyces sp. NPDC094472]|uniref:acetolactate decarboxylase n=1 Tax=unclassified Streptomyces TaxID=2593676 RepID=UPI003330087F
MTRSAPVEICQTSTTRVLIDGVCEGDVTIGELLRHGDFGVGTSAISTGRW